METNITLTQEELDFICAAIAEVYNLYNEDGIITLFGKDYKEQMAQALASKLEPQD